MVVTLFKTFGLYLDVFAVPNLVPYQRNQVFAGNGRLVDGIKNIDSGDSLVHSLADLARHLTVTFHAARPFDGIGPDIKTVPGGQGVKAGRLLLKSGHPSLGDSLRIFFQILGARLPKSVRQRTCRPSSKNSGMDGVYCIQTSIDPIVAETVHKLFYEPRGISGIEMPEGHVSRLFGFDFR